MRLINRIGNSAPHNEELSATVNSSQSAIKSAAPPNGSNAASRSLVTADARDPPICTSWRSAGMVFKRRENERSVMPVGLMDALKFARLLLLG